MPQPSVEHLALPFEEAIAFFQDKVPLPTETWRDIWQGAHSRAFVVAGAARDDLLADLFDAVDKGVSKGTTLDEFGRDFDSIVSRYGWQYKGSPGWRSAVIFNTNLSTAYAAGHYKQMTDPDVLQARPFFRYAPSSSANPRASHMQWYNLVLAADDPFWDSHYPPNDWGCKCGVVNHSAREVDRIKKEEAGGPHPIQSKAPPAEHYEWTDKATGEVHKIPKGIGPGWDYNPGKTAWGQPLSKKAMAAWDAQGAGKWERLTGGDFLAAGRPEKVPVDQAQAKVGPKLKTKEEATAALEKILGGEEKVFSFKQEAFRHDLLVNAKTLAEHVDLARSPFFPFIPEALENPYEVWLSFERHKGTGQVVLRQRFIKMIQTEKERGLLVVAQARNGMMEAWTVLPTSDLKYVNKQRVGKLLWAR